MLYNVKTKRATKGRGSGLLTDVILAIFRVNGSLLEAGDRLVAPLGLTSARWQVMGAIALAGTPLSSPQIGAAMGITRQGVQKQLNALLSEGLIEKHSNPKHERSVLYALSIEGMRIYSEVEEIQAEWAAKLAKGLTTDDLKITRRILETLNKRLSENGN